jgi:hypothetical protein
LRDKMAIFMRAVSGGRSGCGGRRAVRAAGVDDEPAAQGLAPEQDAEAEEGAVGEGELGVEAWRAEDDRVRTTRRSSVSPLELRTWRSSTRSASVVTRGGRRAGAGG